MALTAAQKVVMNRLLSQYPSSSTHSTILADMWELLPNNAQVNAAKATWKTETAAKITASKTAIDAAHDDGTGVINSA